MGDYGIKVLKSNRPAGVDVLNAQPKDLVILSSAESHKVAFAGSLNPATGTFTHNLGYIPFFQSYVEDASGNLYPQGFIDDQLYDDDYTQITTTVLTSYQYANDGTGITRTRYYTIFFEN